MSRLPDIDIAKGIAIILVVLGHLIADEFPSGNTWYVYVHRLVYSFHMPFFIYLTGYVMQYTFRPLLSPLDYWQYVQKKFMRLIPAYLLFAFVIGFGKYIMSSVAAVENPLISLSDVITVLLYPNISYCSSLWYIYTVFIYYIFVPPLLLLKSPRTELVIILSMLTLAIPYTNLFALGRACDYLIVFLLGCYAARNMPIYLRVIYKYRLLFWVAFALGLAIAAKHPISKVAMGIFAAPALHALARSRILQKAGWLGLIGKYAFPIYLMNTIALGLCRVLLQKCGLWDGVSFMAATPVLLTVGIITPIVIQKYLISRTPILRSIVR